jgi:hypothetical protein
MMQKLGKNSYERTKLLRGGEGGSRGQVLYLGRAQQRVAHSNWWKSSHGKSQSHVAWMAGGDGNVAF